MAQYEQKILQGQRRRRGRFSSSSTPDVSRHASVCSSEQPTPREHQPAARGAAEPGSGVSLEEHGSYSTEKGLGADKAGPEHAVAVEDRLSERGPSQQAQRAAAGQLDNTEDDAVNCSVSGTHHCADLDPGKRSDKEHSRAAASLKAQLESGGDAASVCRHTAVKQPGAANAESQLPAERNIDSDAEVLPVSSRASASPASEPEPRIRPCQGVPSINSAASALDESTCSTTTSSRGFHQREPVLPESTSHDGQVEQPGVAAAAPLIRQSNEESPSSSPSTEPSASTLWSPSTAGAELLHMRCVHTACPPASMLHSRTITAYSKIGINPTNTAGHGKATSTVDAPGEHADRGNVSSRTSIDAPPSSRSAAAPTQSTGCTTAAAPSSSEEATPGSRGAAEAGPAAAPGTTPGPAERSAARQQDGRGSQLSAESAREPEWVAAFRRVVSLAVNTPLSQSPAARRVSFPNGILFMPPYLFFCSHSHIPDEHFAFCWAWHDCKAVRV